MIFLPAISFAQTVDSAIQKEALRNVNISSASLKAIEKKYANLEAGITKQSGKLLSRLQKQEAKLQKQVQLKDSVSARQLFAGAAGKYQSLQDKLKTASSKLNQNGLKEYIPGLDSMQTAMHFLEKNSMNIPGLNADKLKQVQAVSERIQSLQSQLQKAGDIKAFIKERSDQFKDQFAKLGLTKQLTGLNKEMVYYNQQFNEYKSLINDRKRAEEKALSTLRSLPAFQSFMQRNSYLAQLFGGAGSGTTVDNALMGLQSRAQVSSLLGQRMGQPTSASGSALPGSSGMNAPGASGGAAEGLIQGQIGQGQDQLNQLKNKVNQFSGSGDISMPDYKPNSQKTKRLLDRLEYGINLQSQRSSGVLPSTTDLGVSLGYKLSDAAVIGIGGSYKQGWGTLFSHIRLSGQGMSLRSFVDIKAKGSFWVTGGYELNYMQGLDSLSRVAVNVSKMQKSGLLGITKKYRVGKKSGKLQILWDYLSYAARPQAQAFKFRVGYNF